MGALKDYRKFILSALAAGLVVLQTAVSDGHVTGAEWWLIATAILGATGVIVVRNGDKPEETERRVI